MNSKNNNMEGNFTINDGSGTLVYKFNPKVIFKQELQIGRVSVPVQIEVDFTGVEPSYHEDLLRMAYHIYAKDTIVNGK